MNPKPGLWTFVDLGNTNNRTTGNVSAIQKGILAAAFAAASATLSPSTPDNLIGYDPMGRSLCYSSVKFGQKMTG